MEKNTTACPASLAGSDPNTSAPGINLLASKPVAALVRSSAFPGVLQASVLVIFIALAVIGWGHYTPEGVNAKLYAKTNMVNLVIWGLWWPAIIWVTFFLGRAWCMACPLEFVSSSAEKLAGVLGFRQMPMPNWLVRGSLAVVLFALLQMLVPGVEIHRVPHYTSLFLWGSLILAFTVGVLFKNRAFCRGFCPVSLLLSAYGRGAMMAVRSSRGAGAAGQAPNARSCPSLLNPARLNSSKDCLVCGHCIKADTRNTMQLLLRRPFSGSDAREKLAPWSITTFVMVASGFVTYELSGVWKAAEPIFLWAPRQASAALGAGAAAGWIQGLWTIVLVPVLLWMLLGMLTLVCGGAKSLGEAWRRLALPVAVVVAAGHMAKGLEKFTSWVGFLPYAWAEPGGVQTAVSMHAKTMTQPTALLGMPSLSAAAMALLLAGMLLALRETRIVDRERGHTRFLPILVLGGFYFFLAFGWGSWSKWWPPPL